MDFAQQTEKLKRATVDMQWTSLQACNAREAIMTLQMTS